MAIPLDKPYLSVVVPAYNEEARIGRTLDEIEAYLSGRTFTWEILVVDDGSVDRTREIVEEAGRRIPGIRVLPVAHGGKGWAVRQGMLSARGRLRFMADADLAMPIDQLDGFLTRAEDGYDVMIASREAPGARRYGEPHMRHVMGRVFNWVVRLLAVRGFQDTQCGFKCFTSGAADDLFRIVRIDGLGFDVEVLYAAKKRGLSIVEVPIQWRYQPRSKVRPLRDSILALTDILRIRLRSLAGKYDS